MTSAGTKQLRAQVFADECVSGPCLKNKPFQYVTGREASQPDTRPSVLWRFTFFRMYRRPDAAPACCKHRLLKTPIGFGSHANTGSCVASFSPLKQVFTPGERRSSALGVAGTNPPTFVFSSMFPKVHIDGALAELCCILYCQRKQIML